MKKFLLSLVIGIFIGIFITADLTEIPVETFLFFRCWDPGFACGQWYMYFIFFAWLVAFISFSVLSVLDFLHKHHLKNK